MNSVTPETYCDVFEQLEKFKVAYVVISGVAVTLHGYVRPLADLDIVIDPAPENAQRVMQALTLAGFVPSLPLPLNMVTVLRLFDGSEREVDVFVRYHIPFSEVWAAAKETKLGNNMVHVISLAHLIRAKRISARPHDLEDIAALESIQNRRRD